jgi:hypothetical protein
LVSINEYEEAIDDFDLSNFDLENQAKLQQMVYEIGLGVKQVQAAFIGINEDTRRLQDAYERVRADVAAGERIQAERLVARRRAAAVVQGYRTRDVVYRDLRNEQLAQYNALFDLAQTYTYCAAKAYDYETGLLGTDTGKNFVRSIISNWSSSSRSSSSLTCCRRPSACASDVARAVRSCAAVATEAASAAVQASPS